MPGDGKAAYIHCPELFEADDAAVHQVVIDLRELRERHFGIVLGSVDVEILNIREAGALVHAHSGDNWNLLLTFLKSGDGGSADSGNRRVGDIHICNARQIRAIRIHGKRDLRILISPFVARPLCKRRRAQDVFDLAGNLAQLPDVVALLRGVDIGGAGDANFDRIIDRIGQQLPRIQPRPGNGSGEDRLQFADELRGDLFVCNLDQHLRVVQLLELR